MNIFGLKQVKIKSEVKLLEITIDNSFTFDTNYIINNICTEDNQKYKCSKQDEEYSKF